MMVLASSSSSSRKSQECHSRCKNGIHVLSPASQRAARGPRGRCRHGVVVVLVDGAAMRWWRIPFGVKIIPDAILMTMWWRRRTVSWLCSGVVVGWKQISEPTRILSAPSDGNFRSTSQAENKVATNVPTSAHSILWHFVSVDFFFRSEGNCQDGHVSKGPQYYRTKWMPNDLNKIVIWARWVTFSENKQKSTSRIGTVSTKWALGMYTEHQLKRWSLLVSSFHIIRFYSE